MPLRLMIDTNIFIDVLTERDPFYTYSKTVLDLCECKKVSGFLTASAVTDIFYLVHRTSHNIETAYKALGAVFDIVNILPVTNNDVMDAYNQRATDFEDCLLATCAKANYCDAIVTRNKRDYCCFDIALYSPEALTELFK